MARWTWLDLAHADPMVVVPFEEQLLNREDSAACPQGILLTWESARECVVLGRSGDPECEVHLQDCRRSGVPVLRRCSGGSAVLLGPGCLNFALVVPFAWEPKCRNVRYSLAWVLARTRKALALPGLRTMQPCDLALEGRKVSGNAQRRARNAFLHHGTLLYDFDAARVERFIRTPRRQPCYRRSRSHSDFLGNLPLSAGELKQRLARAWVAAGADTSVYSPCDAHQRGFLRVSVTDIFQAQHTARADLSAQSATHA